MGHTKPNGVAEKKVADHFEISKDQVRYRRDLFYRLFKLNTDEEFSVPI